MFFRLDLVEGTIARYYGSLSGTLNGGLNNMLNPCLIITPFLQQTPRINPTPQRTKDPENNICDLIFKLILDANENNMFMQHLLVDLKQVARRQQIILVELQSGLVNSIQVTEFQRLNDGHEMCLKCLCDFLNYSDAT